MYFMFTSFKPRCSKRVSMTPILFDVNVSGFRRMRVFWILLEGGTGEDGVVVGLLSPALSFARLFNENDFEMNVVPLPLVVGFCVGLVEGRDILSTLKGNASDKERKRIDIRRRAEVIVSRSYCFLVDWSSLPCLSFLDSYRLITFRGWCI